MFTPLLTKKCSLNKRGGANLVNSYIEFSDGNNIRNTSVFQYADLHKKVSDPDRPINGTC